MQVKVKVKFAQSCSTLCDIMDYTVRGNLQARILGRVAFPFSNGSSQPTSPSLQADSLPAEPPGKAKNTGVGKPKNTGVGKPIPSPGDLPDPGIKLGSLALQADSLPTEL